MASELAVVRSLGFPRRLRTPAEIDDFEQELVDQWALAMAAAGHLDSSIAGERASVVEFVRFLGRPVWSAAPEDADRYLRWLRGERRQAHSTVKDKAWTIGRFFDFLGTPATRATSTR